MAPIQTAPISARQTLSGPSIARVAKAAGFTGDDLPISIAVALAESGGEAARVSPVNSSDGSRDYGEWQINGTAHADLFDQHPNWWDPQVNAAMAKAVFDASGWSAWTTFSSGAYKAHMGAANTSATIANMAGKELHGTSTVLEDIAAVTVDPMIAIGDAVKAIAQGVFKAGAWIGDPHNWVRAALVGLGGALLVSALTMVAKPPSVSQSLQAAVTKGAK